MSLAGMNNSLLKEYVLPGLYKRTFNNNDIQQTYSVRKDLNFFNSNI